MSEMTEALQSIEIWLQNHMPNRAAELKPGITRDEIDEQVKDLPFSLPDEVYELYQWHDGSVDMFAVENYDFLSLGSAIAIYHEWLSEALFEEPEEASFFEKSLPIFQLWSENGVLLSVVCEESQNYPVRMLDIYCKDFSVRYLSLKDFILHVADWYESAQYYEQDNFWEVEAERESFLAKKYMTNK